jgi:hypothetical protein
VTAVAGWEAEHGAMHVAARPASLGDVKFLCLAYYDVQAFEGMPGDRLQEIVSQCPPLDARLRESGHLLSLASLGEVAGSVCVRPRGGKPIVTDGPFMETNEQIGSFFLIEAADMAEAVRIASMHPAATLGDELGWGIEIRPVRFFLEPGALSAEPRGPIGS